MAMCHEPEVCPQCDQPVIVNELKHGEEPLGHVWHARCWAEYQVEYEEWLNEQAESA